MLHQRPSRHVLIAAAALLATAAAPSALRAAPYGYEPAPDALIVKMTEVAGEMDASAGSPSVAVYGDGRVVVHRPAYLQDPGDRVFRLSAAELDALVASLVAKNLPDFDAEGARAAKRSALQARLAARAAGPVSLRAVLDAPTTVIELHLTSPGRAAGVDRTISWYGVRADAEQYPDVVALRDLAAVRAELLELMRRADGGER